MEKLTEQEIARLLQQGSWVRTLARTLAMDEDKAHDLEQRAWEITLNQPSGKITDAQKWFSGVLRNLGVMQWREDKSRARREDIVATREQSQGTNLSAESTPIEIQESIETARLLTASLSELAEPYRTVLYLRFYEELKVREVAGRLNIPESTAQYRISTGLQMLRTRMHDQVGTHWHASCLALAGPISSSIKTTFLSTTFMATSTKIALSALLLTLASFWVLQPDTEPREVSPLAWSDADLASSPERNEGDGPMPASASALITPEVLREGMDSENGNALIASANRIVVQAVDAYDLTPLTNAEVFLMSEEEVASAAVLHEDWRIWDWERRFDEATEATATSENGSVSLPHTASSLFLGARTADRFGFLELKGQEHPPTEPVVILLERPLHQDALVVDEHGVPVEGAIVGYARHMPDFSGPAEALARTNAEGRAQLRHLQPSYLVNSLIPNSNTIALLTPSREPQFVEIATEDFGKEVIEFRMPPTTGVSLTCRWTDGESLADGTEVFLQAVGHKPDRHPSIAHGALSAVLNEGVAEFDAVEVGLELEVKIHSPLGEGFLTNRVWASNARDEISRLSVEFSLPSEIRKWRLLQVDGTPLATTPVQASSRKYDHELDSYGKTHSYISWKPSTDANGTLAIDMTEPVEKGAGNMPLVLAGSSGAVGEQWIKFVHLDLSSPWEPGNISSLPIGEQLLVGGVVLNANGTPVANYPISLQVVEAGIIPTDYEYSLPSIGNAYVLTNDLGEFRFRGGPEMVDKTLHLQYRSESARIGKWKRATGDLGVPLGTEGFEIRIPTSYKIQGRVLVDNPAWYMELEAQGRYPTLSPGHNRYGERGFLDHRNGSFAIQAEDLQDLFVELNQYQPHVYLGIMELPPIDSSLGNGVIRIPDWDLRGRLFRHVIAFQLPAGTDSKWVSIIHNDETTKAHIQRGESLTYFSTQASMPLRFEADGFRTAEVTVSGDTDVTLEAEANSSQ